MFDMYLTTISGRHIWSLGTCNISTPPYSRGSHLYKIIFWNIFFFGFFTTHLVLTSCRLILRINISLDIKSSHKKILDHILLILLVVINANHFSMIFMRKKIIRRRTIIYWILLPKKSIRTLVYSQTTGSMKMGQ